MKTLGKFITACIIGKPNVGKSTLLNYMVGQKISIVTYKVQTTRNIITGITHIKDMQVLLYDTPGIFSPKKALEKTMVKYAWSSLNSADLVILVLDITKKIDADINKVISFFKQNNNKVAFVLNKIDRLNDKQTNNYLSIKEYLNAQFTSPKIFDISAITGNGVNELKEYIYSQASNSGWLYNENEITTIPMKFIASEITREQLFLILHEELPYRLAVYTDSWEEKGKGIVNINQTILVAKSSYKAMILGKNGKIIKQIGIKAREEINKVLDIKANLYLFIKVKDDWDNSSLLNQYIGYNLL